ncbi:alpha/beta fold hydrolase [Halalkalibacillus halophilus]|uniref:alpha/beta fold hydrolase n=1 Tax=Halalkalibacillus halophilus TaxID=392827 RepID=UPI00042A4EB6|nr:alpha/beta fold hydrolase [Halalkalibacillus halophilus]
MKTILVHGFLRNDKDMLPLAAYMQELGYKSYTPDLPLTFREFDLTVSILDEIVNGVVNSEMEPDEKVHLVGHSTGGLVIRKLLSETNHIEKIGRAVLLGTPNRGSQLADFANRVKGYTTVFKTVRSLSREYLENIEFRDDTGVEIGAIAGNVSNRPLGRIIKGENDGIVEVESVFYEGLKDFKVLPFSHTELHYKAKTAVYIDRFLRSGKFN